MHWDGRWTSGEHDEATPAVVSPLVDALPDARQPERFLGLVEAFLCAHDS